MLFRIKRKRITSKEIEEIALIQAMASDDYVREYYVDFIPQTNQGRNEYRKYFGPVPTEQSGINWHTVSTKDLAKVALNY